VVVIVSFPFGEFRAPASCLRWSESTVAKRQRSSYPE
jgi:hypothetical protein